VGNLTMATFWREQLLKQRQTTACLPAPDVDTVINFPQMNFEVLIPLKFYYYVWRPIIKLFDHSQIMCNLFLKQATWINKKYFWLSQDFDFEARYKSHFQSLKNRKIVKVFILPHSHNDPGWRRSYDEYFNAQTRYTLTYAVEKLTLHPKMTFIWSEITYLAKWWETADPKTKEQLIALIREGRLEIGTGGINMIN